MPRRLYLYAAEKSERLGIYGWKLERRKKSDVRRSSRNRLGGQQIGFGEFAEYTYVGILTYKPKYVEFLL